MQLLTITFLDLVGFLIVEFVFWFFMQLMYKAFKAGKI